jgi:cytochrome c2
MVTSSSEVYHRLLSQNLSPEALGKAKFLHGDMGGIYPHTLKTNGFVYKIAVLSLKVVDSVKTTQALFKKYGFQFPRKIWNWEEAPTPSEEKAIGLIFGNLSGRHPLKGKYIIETADFGCGTCHAGPLYGNDGMPTDLFVLGTPNTSINLQAYAKDLFEGYQIIIDWSENKFEKEILELYPTLGKEELTGLKMIFKRLKREVKKIVATRGTVSTYKIGGAGTMNGVGAIKNGLDMLDQSTYHHNEVSVVSIPSFANRSFRSSFLVCGNYAPKGNMFFHEITSHDTTDRHDQEMATIIALFTIGTMGYNAELASESIPDVKNVMKFISKFEPPSFPGEVDLGKAELGRFIFEKNCQSCHGKYEASSGKNRLVSFPNQFVPLAAIHTDSVRAVAITAENLQMLSKMELKKYFEAKVNKGYVAPILSGAWATAPYLHNGSVPTLWHLMHPEHRPEKFYVGGHALDFEKVGVMGELKNGVYQYPEGYVSWAAVEIYDTQQAGMSNAGHLDPFRRLSEKEKDSLLEFIKTL